MESKLSRAIQGYRHDNYKHTVEVSKFCKQVVTGEDYKELVIRYSPRETEEQKKQRVNITHVRTKDIAGKVDGFIDHVFRQDKLKFSVTHDDKAKQAVISSHIDKFGDDGSSLLIWAEQTAHTLNDIDPNAFIWVKHSIENGLDNFEPVIFESVNVLDFKLKKGVVEYNVCDAAELVPYQAITDKVTQTKSANVCFYYYFDKNIIQQAILVDDELSKYSDYYERYNTNEENTVLEKLNGKSYIVITEINTIQRNPVTRVGYIHDKKTKQKTYVSFWDKATELYKMVADDGSSLDITKKLHIFPKAFEYFTDCNYQDPDTNSVCKGGKMHPNKTTCKGCHGTGRQIHTSPQDVILIKIPDDGEQMVVSPKDMAFYLEPPMNIVEFEQRIVESYSSQIMEAIYGIDISKPSTTNATATEITSYYETAQNTLYRFTRAPKKLFLFAIDTIAAYKGIEGLERVLEYPTEYNLESEEYLISLLAAANNANATPEIIENITKRLTLKQNRSDREYTNTWEAMRKFMPFGGVAPELRQAIILNLPISDLQRSLALNFKEITEDILLNHKDFPFSSYEKQKEIVKGKAQTFVDMSKESERVDMIADVTQSRIENQDI